jgi:hypothetical protein
MNGPKIVLFRWPAPVTKTVGGHPEGYRFGMIAQAFAAPSDVPSKARLARAGHLLEAPHLSLPLYNFPNRADI